MYGYIVTFEKYLSRA